MNWIWNGWWVAIITNWGKRNRWRGSIIKIYSFQIILIWFHFGSFDASWCSDQFNLTSSLYLSIVVQSKSNFILICYWLNSNCQLTSLYIKLFSIIVCLTRLVCPLLLKFNCQLNCISTIKSFAWKFEKRRMRNSF